jgi:hypothetical protein
MGRGASLHTTPAALLILLLVLMLPTAATQALLVEFDLPVVVV